MKFRYSLILEKCFNIPSFFNRELIHALEDLLTLTIPQNDLAASADSWEVDINNLAKEDSDIAEYINDLEKSKDATDIPDVSGEMIAKEFERYLRRRTTV